MTTSSNGKPPRNGQRKRAAAPPVSAMPVLDDAPEPSTNGHQGNGHATYPPGVGSVLVDEGDRGGQNRPEYLDFMTAHTENMARLLAESVLDEDLLEQYIMVMEDDQQKWGFVSMPSIIKAKIAGTIGLKARGREDAVKVATAPGATMRKASNWARKIFGMGGGSQAPGGTPTGDMGY